MAGPRNGETTGTAPSECSAACTPGRAVLTGPAASRGVRCSASPVPRGARRKRLPRPLCAPAGSAVTPARATYVSFMTEKAPRARAREPRDRNYEFACGIGYVFMKSKCV